MADIKLPELPVFVGVLPNNAKMYVVVDDVSYQIDKENLVPVVSRDNVRKIIDLNFPDSSRDNATEAQFASAINFRTPFTVSETEIPIIKSVSSNGSVWYIDLINVGKGTYGLGATQLTAVNIKISVNKQPETEKRQGSFTLDATLNNVHFWIFPTLTATMTVPFDILGDMRISGYVEDNKTFTITPGENVVINSKNGMTVPEKTSFSLVSNGIITSGSSSIKYWTLEFEVEGGTKPVPLIDVVYADLLVLISTSKLIKGQKYRLTDYETVYTQPVTGNTISSGIKEVLHITATDVNKLHNICQSELYPQDIVYYEVSGIIDVDYGTEGFTKGKIYRRIDTLRNNDIGTDWRHVKYDRAGGQKLLFENYTDCFNNIIKTYYLFNSLAGFGFANNTISDNFNNNTISDNFNNNTISDNFNSNTISNNFSGNTILINFRNNSINNNFKNNSIGEGFTSNFVSNNFKNNTIQECFVNNNIEEEFRCNIIKADFQDNGGTTRFSSRNTVFESRIININNTAEMDNAAIELTVYRSPIGTIKQRYCNDADVLVISNV